MLSHELRNPLAPIRNAVTLLQRVSTEESLKQCTDIIDRQLTLLTRVVDDVMDVSRITTGTVRIARERVDMVRVLTAALHDTRLLAQELNHRVIAKLPNEPLFVLGDSVRLTQVFVSLLNNASTYTPEGREVALSLRDGDGTQLSGWAFLTSSRSS